jgi:RNA polymerase sigma-70 factor (ECF subfamily)
VVIGHDEEEFDALYRRLSPRLMGQAYSMTGSRTAAEDLIEAAIGRAWVRWGEVRRLQNPEAWIRRVMLNQAISDWRKRSRPNLADRTAQVGDESDVDAIWLADALRALPRNHCRAIVLHDAAGLTVPEIARELHVPAGTVKSWLSRGRATLAVLLTDSKEDARNDRR